MPSLFSALTQISSRINDVVMGERLRVTPKAAAGRYQAGEIDPDRAVIEASGIYRENIARTATNDGATGRDFNRAFMTPKITISIRRDELGADTYRATDIITRLDVIGEPRFEIVAVDPIADGRIAFTVVVSS